MKKILAVSGGIDSMCLLDMLKNETDVVVAHFNHGTRPSSDDDEKFVIEKAKEIGLPYYVGKANLGPNVSEAVAREARYKFLRKLAKKLDGQIVTAHHLNDFCETVAINFLRGTGWRGLSALYYSDIARPMLSWSKSKIYNYSYEHGIIFRQDPTNNEDDYLRNRIRPQIAELLEKDEGIGLTLALMGKHQANLRTEIEAVSSELLPFQKTYSREMFNDLDDYVAEELIRAIFKMHNVSATRPQMQDFLKAIRTYESGKKFNLPKDRLVKFNKTEFML